MPKLVAGNPVVLDSGDVGTVISDSRVFIEKIMWSGVNAPDVCTLTDGSGAVIFSEEWGAGGSPIQVDFNRQVSFNGLELSALTNGSLKIFFY